MRAMRGRASRGQEHVRVSVVHPLAVRIPTDARPRAIPEGGVLMPARDQIERLPAAARRPVNVRVARTSVGHWDPS